jgi:hypothetical protein
VIGQSSEFINAGSEFLEKNKIPLNVTFYSDRMSRSFNDIFSFDSESNYDTGMDFWRMRSSGGISSFFSLQQEPTPDSLLSVNLQFIVNRAKTRGFVEVDSASDNVIEMATFATPVPDSHVSTIFFGGNPTRPGYIIEPGSDDNDIFELDEKSGKMYVRTNEIVRESNFYYIFEQDQNSYIPSTGHYGINVKIVKDTNVPGDVYGLL